MRAESQRVCKVCGTLLPETSDACPVCVLRGALKPEDDSRPSVDPSVSELCFDHYQVLKDEDGTPMELGRFWTRDEVCRQRRRALDAFTEKVYAKVASPRA